MGCAHTPDPAALRIDALEKKELALGQAIAEIDSLVDVLLREQRTAVATGKMAREGLRTEMAAVAARMDAVESQVNDMQSGVLPGGTPVDSDSTGVLESAALYRQSHRDLMAGDAETAREGFEEFLDISPSGPLSDNALYWLGECDYATANFENALESFQRVIREHPEGDKVPASMLKVALTLVELGQRSEARTAFVRVEEEFPDSEEAQIARQRREEVFGLE